MTTTPDQKEKGRILLSIARKAISQALKVPYHASIYYNERAEWLTQPGATFVTLTEHEQLRGCIGSLLACDPLIDDICNNAVSAALRDPRFTALTADEFDQISIEVSLLSELQPMDFTDEQDALSQLRPGIDGVVFEYGSYRSTFLPQVWDSLPSPQQFLGQLKLKAGLTSNFWSDDVKLMRYTVSKWRETDFSQEKTHG